MQMSHTNFLLVFSSLCFLYPSILSFYKSYYIHSILCFQSSIFSTLYWYNTSNKQMLVYDKCSARISCVYWLVFTYVQKHRYIQYVSALYLISAISYFASSRLSKLQPRPSYWVFIHFLFHMSTVSGGSIYFIFLE